MSAHPPTRSVTRFRVRYAETDQMGVAYHSHYLVWCEVGRTDLIRQIGTPYRRVEEEGVRLAVVEVGVRYLAGARYDDAIRVETTVERVRSRTVEFAYRIVREEPGPEALLATATTRLMALGRDGSPRTLPDDLLERLGAAAGSSTP